MEGWKIKTTGAKDRVVNFRTGEGGIRGSRERDE